MGKDCQKKLFFAREKCGVRQLTGHYPIGLRSSDFQSEYSKCSRELTFQLGPFKPFLSKTGVCAFVSLWLIQVNIFTLFLFAQWQSAELKVSVDKSAITIGDIVNLKLEVKRPESSKIAFPSLGPRHGDWIVRNSIHLPSGKAEPGWASEALQLELTIYKTGEFEIPPLTIEEINSEGERKVHLSEPVKIKVQSVLNKDDKELKEIKAQADIPPDYKPFLSLLAALGALAIIIYMAFQYYKNRKRPRPLTPKETRSYDEIAREAIRILLAKKLVENGLLKQFYLELSEIIKKYLGSKLGIISLERTTEEFTQDLRKAVVPWEHHHLIKEFLMDCDLVKFAKYKPAEEEISRIVQRALEIIDIVGSVMTKEATALEVPS
jgi:hypothetical protein